MAFGRELALPGAAGGLGRLLLLPAAGLVRGSFAGCCWMRQWLWLWAGFVGRVWAARGPSAVAGCCWLGQWLWLWAGFVARVRVALGSFAIAAGHRSE